MATSLDKDSEHADLKSLLERYQECATYLMQNCQKINHVPGAVKLERKCAAELKYLRSLSKRRGDFNITHLRSSNLGHYAGIIHSVENLPDVMHILQAFSCPGRTDALHMDVVAYNGHAWIKVIARNAQAIHLTWAGQGQFGERDITLQADDYLICSKQHTVNFQVPKVVFAFYNGVTMDIAGVLRDKGIVVIGELLPVNSHIARQLSDLELQESESDDSETGFESSPLSSAKWDNQCIGTQDNALEDFNLVQRRTTDITSAKNDEKIDHVSVINFTCNCRICIEWNGKPHSPEHLPVNVDGKSDKGLINLMEDENDACEEKIILSAPFNESLVSNVINNVDEKCGRFSPSRNDCTGISSSSTGIKEFTSQSNQSNLVSGGDLDSKSGDNIPSENQFRLETDLRNESDIDLDSRQDKWNFGSENVLSFIQNELLLYSQLNYAILRKLKAANEINTIDNIHRVNLDITTLISLVSAVSHGGCHYKFREKILSEQAMEERRDPVLPKLFAFLEGKSLYACQTSVDSFNSIIDTLGGQSETSRGKELLSWITVIPDNPSFRASTLPNTGKLKDRSKVIFGTGDSLRAVTATANSGFIRAAERQGVTFSAFVHEARALTESKEATAEPLSRET